MRGATRLGIGLGLLALATGASAGDSKVSRAQGGPIRTDLGSGIVVNKGSTLMREFAVVNDPAMPAQLVGVPGITTVYVSERRSGDYEYATAYTMEATEPLVAVEVRFLCFDIWGERTRVLSDTEIVDVPVGMWSSKPRWRVWSENEVAEHYASIGYVARVRTRSGRVVNADTRAVVDEARRLSAKFTEAQLEPEQPKPVGGR